MKPLVIIAIAVSALIGSHLAHPFYSNHNPLAGFTDDFNAFDTDKWKPVRGTVFNNNTCDMVNKALLVKDSQLRITVDSITNPIDGWKSHTGGGISSTKKFVKGEFILKAKFNMAPGAIHTFQLQNSWIRYGYKPKIIRYNIFGDKPDEVRYLCSYFDQQGNLIEKRHTHKLKFNSSDRFHQYGVKLEKNIVSFSIDGEITHSEKLDGKAEPMELTLLHWSGKKNDNDSGEINDDRDFRLLENTKLPSYVYYDSFLFKPLF